MVARILVAILLSLAGAPVLQADSLSVLRDFCEGARLKDAAFERWAEDLPEGNANWQLIDLNRLSIDRRGPSGVPLVCRPVLRPPLISLSEAAEEWVLPPSTVRMLNSVIHEMDGFADVQSGLRRRFRQGRFMSVETLVLFTKSRIYYTRAFLGALDAKPDLEKKFLEKLRSTTGSGP